MIHPLSMFCEKSDPHDQPRLSMTRVVAMLFALTVCYAIVLYARAGKDLVWPFVALGIVTLLAVPLQALAKYLQQWVASSPGQALLSACTTKLLGKLTDHDGDHHGDDK
jgi:hypothetical protein